jgi:hypothetical protein
MLLMPFIVKSSGYVVKQEFWVFTAVTMKNVVLRNMGCGLVRTDVSEKRIASIFRVRKIHGQRKTLAVGEQSVGIYLLIICVI